VPVPVPGLPDPGSVAPADTIDGTPVVAVAAAQAAAVTGGVPWPLLAAGGALVATSAGLTLVAGSRRPGARGRASTSSGSA
jgi:hypothetical protein